MIRSTLSMTLRTRTLFATLALGLALPLAAQAQPTASRTAEGAVRHGGMQRQNRADVTPEQRTARVERHLTELRTQLRITTAQQPQWDGFAAATRENAAALHTRFEARAARLATMSAAENMVDYAEISELHAQQLSRLGNRFTALYAVLAPDQQRDADTLFRAHQGRGVVAGR
jgi:hypothetical protein